MKKLLAELFLKREWLLYLISLTVAYILTIIIFLILNNRYDSNLRDQFFTKNGRLAASHTKLSYKYHHLATSEKWADEDPDLNNKNFLDVWKSLDDDPRPTGQAD